MPVSKQRRGELIDEYAGWLNRSQAVIIAGYQGVTTKDLYRLRTKVHEAQGELHVVKNTLVARAFKQVNLPVPENLLDGSVIMSFCFVEPAAVAKAVIDFAGELPAFSVKGGLLGDRLIDPAGVKALAELPPRPVLLAGLLATLQAPMSQLVNVLHAPMREIAQVLKARSEQAQAAA